MESLVEHFAGLPDPRIERTKLHDLLDILVLTILAVICGADSFVEVETWGRARLDWLRTFLPLKNGIPSHDTIGRVFAALSPKAFAACFQSWVRSAVEKTGGKVVAIDGKTVRRSMNGTTGQGPIHLVGAWTGKNRTVLGQVRTSEKSNEITAIPELLRVLELAGCIVTIDAMGCQKAIAGQIVAAKADYLLALKDNHPSLCREVEGFFHDSIQAGFTGIPHDYAETRDESHDRDEVRRCWTSPDLDWLPEKADWPGLQSVVCIEATRTVLGKDPSIQRRFYLCSIENPPAAFVLALARAHWGIENRMHWVLDVAFREDESRVRKGNAAENLALVRRIALNLVKAETSTKIGVTARRKKAGWDHDYLLKILCGPGE